MLEWLPFILGGVPLTILISVLGILLAVPLALLGALGRLSKNPVFTGISGYYVYLYPRDAPDRPDLLYLPRPPAARPVRAGPAAKSLYPGDGHVRGSGSGDQLRSVHGGDLPRRHPVGRARAGRSGAGSRDDADADDAQDRAPAGREDHYPAY